MDQLVICVCTYNRPEGLAAALRSLDGQRLTALGDAQVVIVVVDNSTQGTAASVCETYRRNGRFKLEGRHEPKKGLVHARNACLAAARGLNATHIVLLDDDEMAAPTWLERLYDRIASQNAAAAVGPVFPVFEGAPPLWLPVQRYVNRVADQGGFAEDGYTCNAIVAMPAIVEAGAAFDLRFNETGGEDTMFFRALRERGGRIAWVEDARVYETVPAHRMTRSWLFRRWYRTGNVEARLDADGGMPVTARLAALGKGLARLAIGVLRVLYALAIHAWRRPDRFTASFYTVCRGAGYATAAFGASYREYSRPAYR